VHEIRRAAWTCLVVLCVGRSAPAQQRHSFGQFNDGAVPLSLVQLIATPEKFENKIVTVEGALTFDDEGDMLCLSADDAEYVIFKNCLYVSFDWSALETDRNSLTRLESKYVKATGQFKIKEKGLHDLASGGLMAIQQVVENPRNYWSGSEPSSELDSRSE
jgi:hypothetical protein